MEIVKGKQYVDESEGGYGIREVTEVNSSNVSFKRVGPDWAPDILPLHVFRRLFRPVNSEPTVNAGPTQEKYLAIKTKTGFLAFDSIGAVWHEVWDASYAYLLPSNAPNAAESLASKYQGKVVTITITVEG